MDGNLRLPAWSGQASNDDRPNRLAILDAACPPTARAQTFRGGLAPLIFVLSWGMFGGVAALPTGGDQAEAFVDRLFELADSGRLIEPEHVASVLGVKAGLRAETDAGRLWDCSTPGVSRRIVAAVWTPPWAKPPIPGPTMAGVELPTDALEWAASAPEYGKLKVSYRQRGDVQCPAGRQMPDRRDAEISFDNLPAFACISFGLFNTARWGRYRFEMPLPRHHGDGPLVKVLRRPAMNYSVTFLVAYGADERCLRQITIRQDPAVLSR